VASHEAWLVDVGDCSSVHFRTDVPRKPRADPKRLGGSALYRTGDERFSGWAAATADQIQADIDRALTQISNNTLGTSEADTVVLPIDMYNFLKTKYFTAGGFRRSVLEEIMTRNSQLRVLKWARLSTANLISGRRVIYGQFNPETCALVIPQEFEQLPPQPKAMGFVVPCHMRVGGVTVRYPKAFLYQDDT